MISASFSLPWQTRGRSPFEDVRRGSNVVDRAARKSQLAPDERIAQHHSYILQHTAEQRGLETLRFGSHPAGD